MAKAANGQPRKRGRPPGSGSKDDRPTLVAVAGLLAAAEDAEKRMTPSTAMKRAVKRIGPSHLRRLQVKWKAQGEALLAEARGRLRRREAAQNDAAVTIARHPWSSAPPVPSITEGLRRAMASGGIEPVPMLLGRTMPAGSDAVFRLPPPPAGIAELAAPRLSRATDASILSVGKAVSLMDESALSLRRTAPAVGDAILSIGRAAPEATSVTSLARGPLLRMLDADDRLFKDVRLLGDRSRPARRR